MPANPNQAPTPVRDIRPRRKGFCVTCLVMDTKREAPVNNRNQPLYLIWVGDYSGSIVLTLWGEEYSHLRAGDMLILIDVSASFRRNRLQMTLDKGGKIKRYGQDLLLANPYPNMSHLTWRESNAGEWEPIGQEQYEEKNWSAYPGTTIISAPLIPWKF